MVVDLDNIVMMKCRIPTFFMKRCKLLVDYFCVFVRSEDIRLQAMGLCLKPLN